jgi:hypothetical protein
MRDLASVFFRHRSNGAFFVLSFNMDDSADSKREKVFVVAGFLGNSVEWFEVERKWEARVKLDGLDYFHAKDFTGKLHGEAKSKLEEKYGKEEAGKKAKELLEDLKSLIKRSSLLAFCFGILMKDYVLVRGEANGEMVLQSDPYLHAHEQLIYIVATRACKTGGRPGIAFVYDESNKAKLLQGQWKEFKERCPLAAECMTTLSPMDDKTTPAIQVADLIAHTTKRYFENRLDKGLDIPMAAPSQVDLAEFSEWKGILASVAFWEKDYLRELVKVSMEEYKKNKLVGNSNSEFDRFDNALSAIMSVSHDELKRREEQWRKQKAAKKQAKSKSPLSLSKEPFCKASRMR